MEGEEIEHDAFLSFDKQIEETEIEKKLSIPAKRLMEKLEPIPSKIEKLQYRWVWELIQNASDFNAEVDVEFELTNANLIFRHNGEPFKVVDVENLITPDSDKDDTDIDEDYIGRFGSGFISTHVLSAIITVEGLVKDKYREGIHYHFDFDLNRTVYNSKTELIKSIERSEKQFKKNYKPAVYKEGNFDTKFSYDLTKGITTADCKQIAKSGIEYAIKVLPLVFTFLPKLKSVKIIENDNGLKESFFYQKNRDEDLGLCEIGFELNANKQPDLKVRFASHKDVIVATELKDNLAVDYSEDMAVLFLYLPMIGSEKFPFPISIHSSNFKPEAERNAINLSANDTENREGLVDGIIAYKKLLGSLAKDKIGSLYHLVKLKNERIKALPNDSYWFQQNIEKQFKLALDQVEFITCNGTPISYSELQLPFIPDNKTESKDLEFYDTVYELIINEVPSREEYPIWLKNVDFTIFRDVPFRLDEAVKKVEQTRNLDGLSDLLKKSKEDSTKWLANFIKYVLANDTGLFVKYKIIPCKSEEGTFVNRDSEIYVDNGVDEKLIEVYNKMKNQNYYERLLNDTVKNEVKDLLPVNKVKSWESIAKEIDDVFRDTLDENARLSKDEIDGLNLLLKWLKERGFPKWNDLYKYFPTFDSSYSGFFMDSFDDDEKVKAITIRNSGKQDSLVKLAESEITEEELNTVAASISEVKQIVGIIDSGTSISKLTELAQLFPDDIPEQVMNFAKEDARTKKEFNNLLTVGSKVEQLFIKTLKEFEISSNNEEIIHAGGGAYDIRVFNPETDKSFYIELKSCRFQNTDPINIAISQAQRAVKELANENFCIVVIERSADNNMDENYIKLNTKYFKNPGNHLGEIVNNFEIVKNSTNTSNVVDLKMGYTDFKGSLDYEWIKEQIGSSGFRELLDDISKYLSN